MANKKREEEYDIDSEIDNLGFASDDINGTDVDGLSDGPSVDRTAVGSTLRNVGSGAIDAVVGRDNILRNVSNLTLNTLPEEVKFASDDVSGVLNTTTESFRKARGVIKPSIVKTARVINTLVPDQLKGLKKALGDFADTHDETPQRSKSVEEVQEDAITGALGSIFDKQIKFQIKNEAIKRSEDSFKGQLETERYQTNINVLSSMQQGISSIAAYQTQITKEYQRKSLELQYRSYFTQLELLKTTKTYFEIFKNQNESVVKNTGLPDFVKINTSEKFVDVAREKFFSGIYDKLYNKSSFINQVKKNISDKVEGMATSIKYNIDNAVDTGGGMLEMIDSTGGDRKTVFAEMAGGFLGDTFVDKIATSLRDKYRDKVANDASVKRLVRGSDALNKDPALFLANMRQDLLEQSEIGNNDGLTEDGFWNGVKNKGKGTGGRFLADLLNISSPDSLKMKIDTNSIASAKSPAIFDNSVYRSITDTIPMYLSRILQQATITSLALNKTGEIKAPLLRYDYNGKTLLDAKSMQDKTINDLGKLINEKGNNDKKAVIKSLSPSMDDTSIDALNDYVADNNIEIKTFKDIEDLKDRSDVTDDVKRISLMLSSTHKRINDKKRRAMDREINKSFNADIELNGHIKDLFKLSSKVRITDDLISRTKLIFSVEIMSGRQLLARNLIDTLSAVLRGVAVNNKQGYAAVKSLLMLLTDNEKGNENAVLAQSYLVKISEILKRTTLIDPSLVLKQLENLGFDNRSTMIEAGLIEYDDTGSNLILVPNKVISIMLGVGESLVAEKQENNSFNRALFKNLVDNNRTKIDSSDFFRMDELKNSGTALKEGIKSEGFNVLRFSSKKANDIKSLIENIKSEIDANGLTEVVKNKLLGGSNYLSEKALSKLSDEHRAKVLSTLSDIKTKLKTDENVNKVLDGLNKSKTQFTSFYELHKAGLLDKIEELEGTPAGNKIKKLREEVKSELVRLKGLHYRRYNQLLVDNPGLTEILSKVRNISITPNDDIMKFLTEGAALTDEELEVLLSAIGSGALKNAKQVSSNALIGSKNIANSIVMQVNNSKLGLSIKEKITEKTDEYKAKNSVFTQTSVDDLDKHNNLITRNNLEVAEDGTLKKIQVGDVNLDMSDLDVNVRQKIINLMPNVGSDDTKLFMQLLVETKTKGSALTVTEINSLIKKIYKIN